MKKIIAVIMVCAALFVAGCSGSAGGVNEIQEQETKARVEQQKVETSAAPTVTPTEEVTPTATPSPTVKPSLTPVQVDDRKDAESKTGGKPNSTGTGGGTQNSKPSKTGNSGSGGNKPSTPAPIKNTPAPATPAPESTPKPSKEPEPTKTPTPTPKPTPASTPKPTPEPKQESYAYCSCGAKLTTDQLVGHMKQHALNGESHSYTTY